MMKIKSIVPFPFTPPPSENVEVNPAVDCVAHHRLRLAMLVEL